MVFGVFPERRPHHASDGKIEAGRAELPFVIAVRMKIYYFGVISGVPEHVAENPIDFRVSASALFVGKTPLISDACDDEPLPHRSRPCFIERQPRNGADGSRNEQETVGIAPGLLAQVLEQANHQGDSGKIVIAQRRMANVTRK